MLFLYWCIQESSCGCCHPGPDHNNSFAGTAGPGTLQIRLMEEMPDQDPTLNKACPTPSATIRCAPRLEFELRHWWSQRGA